MPLSLLTPRVAPTAALVRWDPMGPSICTLFCLHNPAHAASPQISRSYTAPGACACSSINTSKRLDRHQVTGQW